MQRPSKGSDIVSIDTVSAIVGSQTGHTCVCCPAMATEVLQIILSRAQVFLRRVLAVVIAS